MHSLPYLPLRKKERKKGERDSPLNWGLLSANTPGLCSSVSKSFETTGLKMLQHASAHRHQMFYTAHQFSSREGFTERLHSLHTVKATAFSFFLSPWDCNEGRGQHCFSSRTVKTQRRTRDEAHDLNNAVRQITKHKHKDKMLSDQRCGINHNGDRFTANS